MPSPVSLDRDIAQREAALRFLYDRVDYERAQSVPYRVREFKLDRMRQLLARLGNPHHGLPIVHVAGTKGKGSTSVMIGTILSAAGYHTGVFTSPHLDRIEERMVVDGQLCSAPELVDLVRRVKPVVEAMDREGTASDPTENSPTYFEITTAMALLHFAARKVDAAVLEVGMGGRLDSTNVCYPRVSVITSISLDHTRQLGDTVEAIAREKAGIVKPGIPLVSGVTDQGPRSVIRQVCRQQGSPLAELGIDFSFDYVPPHHLERGPASGKLHFHYHAQDRQYDFSELTLGLLGRHQAANGAVALAALEQLRPAGWTIPEEAVRTGLAGVVWPARVELLGQRPAIVIDAAHNVASIDALLQALQESFSVRRRLLVFATTQEKDHRGMLERLLGRFDHVVFTRYLSNPRAVPPEQLGALAEELTGRRYPVYPEPAEAWNEVRSLAGPEDLICVTGSFFIAAEIRRQLKG